MRQAIQATRELGLSYIWIDALCIVQDDPDDWACEAAQMQHVYSNATVTISATASSDASEGLFRPRNDSNGPLLLLLPVRLSLRVPRVLRSYSTHIRHWYVLPANAGKTLFEDGPVDKRGWTLQEQEMSTRLLHFGEGVLHWACLTSSGSEADPQGPSYEYGKFYDTRARRYAIQRWDSLGDGRSKQYEKWERLVAAYTKRTLSYASDRVPAILGLARAMAPALRSGDPVAGIWSGGEFGVRSLAWAAQTFGGVANPCYPSWSWASTTAETGYFLVGDYHVIRGRSQTWLVELIDVEIAKTSVSQNYVAGVVRLKGMLGCFDHALAGGYDLEHPNVRKIMTTGTSQEPPLPPPRQDLAAVASTDIQKMSAKKLRKMERKAATWSSDDYRGHYYSDRLDDAPDNCWFMPVVKYGYAPPPSGYGIPAVAQWPRGFMVCLCLRPVNLQSRRFRRIGICRVWEKDVMGSREDVITIT